MQRRRGNLIYISLSLLLLGSVAYYYIWKNVSSEANPPQPPSRCERPLDHIFFLKIHKCGSSTVQNILLRRGFKRGLNFALPEKGNYLGHPARFDPELHVAPPLRAPSPDFRFDVLTHHSRYEGGGARRAMAADCVRVTVLREPASLFQSLYNYFDLEQKKKVFKFANLVKMNLSDIAAMFEKQPRLMDKIGINQMSFDLGMEVSDFHSPAAIQQLISLLERDFQLVMISEHMEASLVLLADLMCWPLEEVTFLAVNSRPKDSYTRKHADNVKLRRLNNVDTAIYDHFLATFKTRLMEYGQGRMENQVLRLMDLNARLMEECVEKTTFEIPPGRAFPLQKYYLRGNASQQCRLLVMGEPDFTEMLRTHQIRKLETLRKLRDVMKP